MAASRRPAQSRTTINNRSRTPARLSNRRRTSGNAVAVAALQPVEDENEQEEEGGRWRNSQGRGRGEGDS